MTVPQPPPTTTTTNTTDDDKTTKHASLQTPLLGHAAHSRSDNLSEEVVALQRAITKVVQFSLAANIVLLFTKAIVLYITGSMAVAASALDSLVDLASQGIIALADSAMKESTPDYPAGKSRLEPIAVLGCAYIMTIGSIEVIRESGIQLKQGFFHGDVPCIDVSLPMYVILAMATLLKLSLYFYCVRLRAQSGAAEALAEDHMNDVASNSAAIAAAFLASYRQKSLWWVDPASGIAISLYIVVSWAYITRSQVQKIVGVAASQEVVLRLQRLSHTHHPSCSLAFLRAFHAGQRLHVDVELECHDVGMGVKESSHVALSLKRILEAVPEVESAAVVVVAHPRTLEAYGHRQSWSVPLVLPSGEYCGHIHDYSLPMYHHEQETISHLPTVSEYEGESVGAGIVPLRQQQQQQQQPLQGDGDGFASWTSVHDNDVQAMKRERGGEGEGTSGALSTEEEREEVEEGFNMSPDGMSQHEEDGDLESGMLLGGRERKQKHVGLDHLVTHSGAHFDLGQRSIAEDEEERKRRHVQPTTTTSSSTSTTSAMPVTTTSAMARGDSWVGHMLWSRSLRDPPQASLRAASFIGGSSFAHSSVQPPQLPSMHHHYQEQHDDAVGDDDDDEEGAMLRHYPTAPLPSTSTAAHEHQ